MIEVRNLRKSYGETVALDGVSFDIERGEVVGLLGPNGAGKTTTMKIVVGYLEPDAGAVRVAGHDVAVEPIEVRRRIGYLPENAPSYGDMLVHEYLTFTADMHGIEDDRRRARFADVVDACAIGDVLRRPIGHLSKGYRQRVGLAAALVHDPDILILDEPTTGLDPNQIVEIRDLIRDLGRTKTVVLSTHILPEVEATCDRAVLVLAGQVRADGSLAELTRSHVLVAVLRVGDEAAEALAGVEGITRVDRRPVGEGWTEFRMRLGDGVERGEQVAALARERGWALRELRRDDRSLEQVFRELTETTEGTRR